MSNIQYFHECSMAANNDREKRDGYGGGEAEDNDQEEEDVDHDPSNNSQRYTQETLEALKASRISPREKAFALQAIASAKAAKIFENSNSSWEVLPREEIRKESQKEVELLKKWKDQMKKETEMQNIKANVGGPREDNDAGVEQLLLPTPNGPQIILQHTQAVNEPLSAARVDELGEDQKRAYEIIIWHLHQTLKQKKPPPLRMIIYGEGGTGKSKVIQTVTEAFKALGAGRMLVKAAYTGTAASLIEGKTTHSIGKLSSRGSRNVSDEKRSKLQKFWADFNYLIIDEYSMIGKTFLGQLSRNIGIGKQGSTTTADSDLSFGGVNVILCGDLHQFPPVAKSTYESLYKPPRSRETPEALIGRKIYEEFLTVVILQ
jgi:PIF1-like helicase